MLGEKSKNGKQWTIGIIGTGTTGKGIAELALKTGNRVILKSRSDDALKIAMKTISRRLSRKMEEKELNIVLNGITLTTKYEDLAEADVIIESVIEDLNIKRAIFKSLEKCCTTETVLASNTSSLRITEITESLEHPERVIGIHFFNPIPKMKLVEIVRTKKTSDLVIKKTHDLASNLEKIAIDVEDVPGFIVNRLLFVMINEACHILDEKGANIKDIDTAMKMGANHPMGPFELADLIGLDLCLEIMQNLNNSYEGDLFEPSKTLKMLVHKGQLGRKTGRGFYEY